MIKYNRICNKTSSGSSQTIDMSPHLSPSWPAFGHVQKLTNLFEEKALPKKMPKILKKPVEMPKLKTELLTKIKTALGEEPERKIAPKPSPKPLKPKPKPITNTSNFHEAQPGDNPLTIGDGRNRVGGYHQVPVNGSKSYIISRNQGSKSYVALNQVSGNGSKSYIARNQGSGNGSSNRNARTQSLPKYPDYYSKL